MTITVILIFVALLALLFLVWQVKDRTSVSAILEKPAHHLRSVDVEAFRNLIDPAEENYLREQLAPAVFRKIQRERLRAAVQYLRGVAQNAAVLMRLAEAARRSPDVATAEAADKLVATAIQLRLYALQATVWLHLGMVIPGVHISSARIAERYEQITRQVVMLGLQYPVPGVSAAL
jgi:hypothetical protein